MMRGPVQLRDGTTIWISLYYDDFGAYRSRNKSLGGLYLTVLNQKTRVCMFARTYDDETSEIFTSPDAASAETRQHRAPRSVPR